MITTLNFIRLFKENTLTLEAATEVASNLLNSDLKELTEGHGISPEVLPSIALKQESYEYILNGRTAAMGGVSKNGQVWLLCTPLINKHPLAFARGIKQVVYNRPEPLLWNIVDKRNTTHLKLLKFLGFKFLRELHYGPNNLLFIEFCRLCTAN